MKNDKLYQKCASYLNTLCEEIADRSVGSEGNRRATSFFEKEFSSLGWQTESSELDVIDWEDGGATLQVMDQSFNVLVSPYSPGCSVEALLTGASCLKELERKDITGKILLLYGDIAKEQLMPKNFVFYNPDEHQKIIALLEQMQPAAIISATSRNAALAGGVYPFPLIEDGDFDIPSVYMTEDEGIKLLSCIGKPAMLQSRSIRIPAKAYNVVSRKGNNSHGIQWPQSDHSIFIQYGCPAIAVSSQWFIEHMDNQDITHTPKDNLDIVDSRKVVEIAEALNWFLMRFNT